MALIGGSSTTQILGRPLARNASQRAFTLTGWIRFPATTTTTFLSGLSNLTGGTSNQYSGLLALASSSGTTGSLESLADERDSTSTEAFASSCRYQGSAAIVAPVNTWYFVAAIYVTLSSRFSWLQRAGGAFPQPLAGDTKAISDGALTHFTVGSVQPNVGDLSGNAAHIAECCLWETDLSLPDITLLAEGASPLSIGPRGTLASYYPLNGNLRDYGLENQGLQDLGTAAYGPLYTDHPPVMPPPRGRQFFLLASGIIGTASNVAAPATVSSTGSVGIAGSLTATTANATLSGTGAVAVRATLAATASNTLVAAGGPLDTATLAATVGSATLASTAGPIDQGALTVTLANAGLVSAGIAGTGGALAVTTPVTLAATAATKVIGQLTITVSATLSAVAGDPDVGALSAPQTITASLASTGQVLVAGSLTTTLGSAILASAAANRVAGSLGVTTPATLAATAVSNVIGQLTASVAATLSAVAGDPDVGILAAPQTISASLASLGRVLVAGSLAASSATLGVPRSRALVAYATFGLCNFSPAVGRAILPVSGSGLTATVTATLTAFAGIGVIGQLVATTGDSFAGSIIDIDGGALALTLQSSALAGIGLVEDGPASLNFVPEGIGAKPLYTFLAPLVDYALQPSDYFVTEVDPLVKPMLLNYQDPEAVNAYINLLVRPVLGTRQSFDYAFKLLNIQPSLLEWWQDTAELRAFRFNLTFTDATLPGGSFDFGALVNMLFALKNERSHLLSIRMDDCADMVTLDNDCILDANYLDSLEGYPDPVTGAVICLHQTIAAGITIVQETVSYLHTSDTVQVAHPMDTANLDFTTFGDDAILDAGAYVLGQSRTTDTVQLVPARVGYGPASVLLPPSLLPQGRTSEFVETIHIGLPTGYDSASQIISDSIALHLTPVMAQPIPQRYATQATPVAAAYPSLHWTDVLDGPLTWPGDNLIWAARQPAPAAQHSTLSTLTSGRQLLDYVSLGIVSFGSGTRAIRPGPNAKALRVGPANPGTIPAAANGSMAWITTVQTIGYTSLTYTLFARAPSANISGVFSNRSTLAANSTGTLLTTYSTQTVANTDKMQTITIVFPGSGDYAVFSSPDGVTTLTSGVVEPV